MNEAATKIRATCQNVADWMRKAQLDETGDSPAPYHDIQLILEQALIMADAVEAWMCGHKKDPDGYCPTCDRA